MEFTKTEQIDLSSIRVRPGNRSDLTTRIQALDAGEAFAVSGVEREAIQARVHPLRREGRKFITTKLGELRYRVTRIA